MTIKLSPESVSILRKMHEDRQKFEQLVQVAAENLSKTYKEDLEALRLMIGLPSLEGFEISYCSELEIALIKKGESPCLHWKV